MSDTPVSWARHDDDDAHDTLEGGGWSNAEEGSSEIAEENYVGSNNKTDNARQETTVDVTCSYGYGEGMGHEARDRVESRRNSSDRAHPTAAHKSNEDAPWERQVASFETMPDEWQWVQEPSTEGYFYNSITGEARWDAPATFQADSSHALVELGATDAVTGAEFVNGAAGAEGGESTLAQYYGGDSNQFTAEDGTVWKYDETLADYIQQHIDEPTDNAKGDLFRLDSVTGSPWQRVESEHGAYYYNLHTEETSWDPPPEWLNSSTTEGDDPSMIQQDISMNSAISTGLQEPGESAAAGTGAGQDDEANFYGFPQDSAFSSVTSAPPYDSSSNGHLGIAQGKKGREGAVDGAAASDDWKLHTESETEGDGTYRDGRSYSGRGSGSGSGSGKTGNSLDITPADEFSQWSLEKLREVSKTLPGKWLVSDSLVKRAVEDYDTMLAMSASDIEAMKNKGTSRIIRLLVGPEDGEDDDDEDSSLCVDSDDDTADSDEYPTPPGNPDARGAAGEAIVPPETSQKLDLRGAGGGKGAKKTSTKRHETVGGRAGGNESDRRSGRSAVSGPPVEEDGNERKRRRSLLGLEEALSVDAGYEGLEGWQPGFSVDGSLFFVHKETGESRWTFPVRAWEVKTRQLALLTPRTPLEVGRGTCRLRETDEMRKKRLDYRWQVEKILAAEVIRREEDPTPEEAAEAVLEKMINTIERREHRKRQRTEHNARTLERARWHPSTSGYLMQRLDVPASTTATVAANANGNGEAPETKTILTDADFLGMKLAQDGSATLWGQKPEPETPEMPGKRSSRRRLEGRGLAAALHLSLPQRLRVGGKLFLPAATKLPTLPSLRGLSRVRSLSDLQREMTALGAAARTAVATKRDRQDVGTGGVSSAVPSTTSGTGKPVGTKSAAERSKEEAASSVVARLEKPGQATAALTFLDENISVPSGRQTDNITAIAPLPVIPSDTDSVDHDGAGGPAAGTDEEPPDDTDHDSDGNRGANILGAPTSETQPPQPRVTVREVADETLPPPRQSRSEIGVERPGDRVDAEEACATTRDRYRKQELERRRPTKPVALAATASLNEQVRGMGGKLALKVERGDLDPSRAGDAAAAMAKNTLVVAGKAMGLSKKSAGAEEVPGKLSRPLTPQPPPPDVSTITIEVACSPPPFNLLTTVRTKDPATGKMFDQDKLTSVLRDAWEGMIIRDVATAGGVHPRQVVIEEVRRRPRRSPDPSADICPFRPDRRDETRRRLSNTESATMGTAPAPDQERARVALPNLHASEGVPVADQQQRQRHEEQEERHELQSGTHPRRDERGLEPLLAPAKPLPPAGLRATFTTRLRTPVAKKRRLGGNTRQRGVRHRGDDPGCRDIPLHDTRGETRELVGMDDGTKAGGQATQNGPGGKQVNSQSSPPLDMTPARRPFTVPGEFSAAEGVRRTHAPPVGSFALEAVLLPRVTGRDDEPEKVDRRRGAVVSTDSAWKGTAFADRSAADGHAFGVGAGNRGDFGVLGRVEQRPGRFLGSAHKPEQVFDPVDKEQALDPEIQAAIQEAITGDGGLKTWQAKDVVMKAMNRTERIPTLHELKLAGRVERARALFGPGGYLDPASTTQTKDVALHVSNIKPSRDAAVADGVAHGLRGAKEEPEQSDDDNIGKLRPDTALGTSPPAGAVDLAGNIEGKKLSDEESPSPGKDSTVLDKTPPPPPQSAPTSPPRQRQESSTEDGGQGICMATKLPSVEDHRERGFGSKPSAQKSWGSLTTVTLKIVGGRPNGRGFTNLEQSGKAPSETVARSVVIQAGVEGSDLLRGGLTHTVVNACWCPASRGRVMNTWEGYWCHSISPVFFGRSIHGRHVTKLEAGRRRQGQGAATAAAGSGEAEKGAPALGGAEVPTRPLSASPANSFINQKSMTPNEVLEQAEHNYQELMSEGLADGVRMNRHQHRAMLIRDRAIKKLLLRRKIKTKRKNGGLTRVRCPYRRISSNEVRGWEREIAEDEQQHRAKKRAEMAARHDARVEDSQKRGERNQLKAWLIRQLVASNEGDRDLMAKAIAAARDDGDQCVEGGRAGKGAPGRESSMFGRNSRPGGRFAYGQEASSEEMKKKDLVIKARRRFELDNEALLRETFRETLADQTSHPAAVTATAPTSVKSDEARRERAFSSSSSPSHEILPPDGPNNVRGPQAGHPATTSIADGTSRTNGAAAAAAGASARASSTRDSRNEKDCSTDASASMPSRKAAPTTAAASPAPPEDSPIRQCVSAVEDTGQKKGRDAEPEVEERHVREEVPRAEVLRVLRRQGSLRRTAMASDAIRPILTDRNFAKAFLLHPATPEAADDQNITEDALALFGSVVAEVDQWYKRVRATLDPVRAKAEARVKSFEARKERARDGKNARKRSDPDGLAPSEAWRRELKVSRSANRGDGREWSRFHHHVLIRAAADLPLYCCLCRRRRWDEARLSRLKGEHATRSSWEAAMSERQEILEPMVQTVVRNALSLERARGDNDENAWAVLHCVERLVSAVPGRVESREASSSAIDTVLEGVMRESCSVEERTEKRRIAALAKLRALGAVRGGGTDGMANGRRGSRRVSVGPSGFGAALQGGIPAQPPPASRESRTKSVPEVEQERKGERAGAGSTPVSPGHGAPANAVEAAAAEAAAAVIERTNGTVVRSQQRDFMDFSDQARAIATTYYEGPRDSLLAAVRATTTWTRLKEVWFQEDTGDSEGAEEEKALSIQACVVETLDKERETWEREERERRGMFAQEESLRRDLEALRRAAEAPPREVQEGGHRAFCALIDTMERRSPSLSRLRWELTANLGDMQRMTTRVRDAATGRRYVCHVLPCRGRKEVDYLLQEAYRIQEIRNPYLVKMRSAHSHRIATYDERGVQTTGGIMVLVQAEFCAGGSLEEHLNQLLAPSRTSATGGGGRGGIGASRGHGNGSYDGQVMGPRRNKVYTPEAESLLKVEEFEQGGQKERRGESVRPARYLARRLEVWVRQVAHALSALHADGGLHRNINSRDVYLDEKGRAKLGGYQFLKGATEHFAAPLSLYEGFGCAATAPPEFELRGETSAKGDVWSLGCALYKWTTGKEFAYLAAGARLEDTLNLVPSSCGDKIKTALFMCLQRDPCVRVSSLALWRFLAANGDKNSAPPPGPAVAQ